MDEGGSGGQANSDLYDKGGFGGQTKGVFPHKRWQVCFFIISRAILSVCGHSLISLLTNQRGGMVFFSIFFLSILIGVGKVTFNFHNQGGGGG